MKTTSITSSHICSTQRRTGTISRTHQHGLTLIEVMISVTISLILLAGVMQIFTSSRQTYTVQDSMGRLQENGRFALSFLTRDVRNGDYWGCLPNATSIVNNVTGGGGFGAVVTGIAGTDGPLDTITVAMATPLNISVVAPFRADSAATLSVTSPNTLTQGRIVILSNCTSGDIFQISNANPGPGNGNIVANIGAATVPGNTFITPVAACGGTNCLSARYGGDAQMLTTQIITYSIANDPANENEPTLFQSVNGGAAVALVEGVENMQILYGEDLDPRPITVPPTPLNVANFSANRYVPAGTAGLIMANVVSVRIGLVLRTKQNNLSTVVQPFNFNGAVVTPADRRLRRVFSTTIGLRNRGA